MILGILIDFLNFYKIYLLGLSKSASYLPSERPFCSTHRDILVFQKGPLLVQSDAIEAYF